MKQDSIKKNFVFQVLYQAIVLVLPLVVSPILTRRMGSYSLGVYSYVGTIAYYFLVFANLGIMKHGQRLIASNRSDDVSLRKAFWSLVFVHFIASSFFVFAYVLFILLFVHNNEEIYWIYVIYVVSALFDITWLFYGLENFKGVVIKNSVSKLLTFLLILFFVKKPSDLPLYTFIESSAVLISNLILLPSAIKHIRPIKFGFNDCTQHIKPLLLLSISTLAALLYTIFDKTLLGIMTTKDNVAFYEYSNKIITIPRAFVAVIGTVLFPKACALASKNDYIGREKYANYAYYALSLISFACMFGLAAVGPKFATIYYGNEFSVCGYIIIALAPLIYIIGLGDIVRNVFLIPQNKDLPYVICLCLNAIINLTLSILLIPKIGIFGAVVGTSVAEFFGLFFQCIYCRRQIVFKSILKSALCFAILGELMFGIIKTVDSFLTTSPFLSLLIEFGVGVFVYTLLSIASTRFLYKDVWDTLLSSFSKRKNSLKT